MSAAVVEDAIRSLQGAAPDRVIVVALDGRSGAGKSTLAATVAGDARKTCDSLLPMRPGKFRLVALMHFIGVFSRPKVSTGPPRQAAHEEFSVIRTPALSRMLQTLDPSMMVLFSSCRTFVVAGTHNVEIFTVLPFTT